MVGNNEGDTEDCLQVGLVEAGERTAGIGRFELGGGHRLHDAVDIGVRRAVEPVQLIVEDAGESEFQHRVSRFDTLLEVDRGPHERLVVADGTIEHAFSCD